MDFEDDDFDVDEEPTNVKSSKKGNLDNSKTVCKIYWSFLIGIMKSGFYYLNYLFLLTCFYMQ